MPRDRFALRYSCRGYRAVARRIAEVEATLADLVRRLGPLLATNSSPGAGSAAPAEGMGDGEHEELGERDTLDQEKRTVSAEYP